jgi:molecular chaperone GrpE
VAGSNRDAKGSFHTDISQDVIDEALKSVERVDSPPPEAEVEAAPSGEEVYGGVTLEIPMPEGGIEEPEAVASDDSGDSGQVRAELEATRQQLEQARRELEEARSQLEFSQSKSREMMERLKDSHERGLRAAADLENYKKRAQKEKEEVQKFGSERLLKDFLPVLDNLDRALEAAAKSADFESFRTGVEMTRKLFDGAFGKHGVKGFSAAGQPFDPRLHEAMQQVESATVPAGHVVYEAVRGYTLNERLMRPALVVVARAPEATSAATQDGAPTGGDTATKQNGTTPTGSQ